MGNYSDLLKDPRWQKTRLKIMERDGWKCVVCGETEKTLSVHHKYYRPGVKPWDYPSESLVTLCEFCHDCEERGIKEGMELDLLEGIRERLLYSQLLCLYDALSGPHYEEVITLSSDILQRTRKEVEAENKGNG
jgi:hypothetical protein